MHSITAVLAMAIMTFSAAIIVASPIDPSTHSLAKRTTWVFGQSTCPDDDGDQYNGPKGGTWRIRCGKDTTVGGYLDDISPRGNVYFKDCIQLCGSYPNRCARVVFGGDVDGQGPCYLKGDSSSGLYNKPGFKVATKLN